MTQDNLLLFERDGWDVPKHTLVGVTVATTQMPTSAVIPASAAGCGVTTGNKLIFVAVYWNCRSVREIGNKVSPLRTATPCCEQYLADGYCALP